MPRYPQSGHRISLVLVTKFQRPRITQQQLGENANNSLNLTRLCAGAIPKHWMKEGRNLKLCVKQLCFKPQPPRKYPGNLLLGGSSVASAWVDCSRIVGSVPGSVILSYLW